MSAPTNIFASVVQAAQEQEVAFEAEIKAIKLEVERAEEHAKALVINDDQDALAASEFLAQLKHNVRADEEKRKKIVKPFNDGVKAINKEFADNAKPFKDAIADLEPKILAYKQKRDAERAAEQAEIERQRQEAAAESFVTGVAAAVIPDAAPGGFVGKAAGVSTRKTWKNEVVDLSRVPLKYLQVDQVQLNADMRVLIEQHKSGDLTAEALETLIPGVRIFQDESLIVS